MLDLYTAEALTTTEFKQRNDVLNEQLRNYEGQLQKICDEEAKSTGVVLNEAEIRRVLEEELSFDGEINSALVASILDKVVVKKESTKEEIHLDIYLKMGQRYEAVYAPQKSSASLIRSKNTMPWIPTRRI